MCIASLSSPNQSCDGGPVFLILPVFSLSYFSFYQWNRDSDTCLTSFSVRVPGSLGCVFPFLTPVMILHSGVYNRCLILHVGSGSLGEGEWRTQELSVDGAGGDQNALVLNPIPTLCPGLLNLAGPSIISNIFFKLRKTYFLWVIEMKWLPWILWETGWMPERRMSF